MDLKTTLQRMEELLKLMDEYLASRGLEKTIPQPPYVTIGPLRCEALQGWFPLPKKMFRLA